MDELFAKLNEVYAIAAGREAQARKIIFDHFYPNQPVPAPVVEEAAPVAEPVVEAPAEENHDVQG